MPFHSAVGPIFDYASQVWGHKFPQIDAVQNKAIKIFWGFINLFLLMQPMEICAGQLVVLGLKQMKYMSAERNKFKTEIATY